MSDVVTKYPELVKVFGVGGVNFLLLKLRYNWPEHMWGHFLDTIEESVGTLNERPVGLPEETVDAGAREAIKMIATLFVPKPQDLALTGWLSVIAEHGAYPPEPSVEQPIPA